MVATKILHFSHTDIDDPRIVNSALTGKKNGMSVFFCGTNTGTTLRGAMEVFESVHWIDFGAMARVSSSVLPILDRFWLGYPYPRESNVLLRRLKMVLETVRPDIIHAHDVFAAHYAIQSGIATVFDDHELYSLEYKASIDSLPTSNALLRWKSEQKRKKWASWEKSAGERAPILSVSKGISDHHKKYCSHVFTVPNFPYRNSIGSANLGPPSERGALSSIYLGRDRVDTIEPFRNISGLHEIFTSRADTGSLIRIGVDSPNSSRITSVGRLQMQDAYRIMREKGQIGLLPWKTHWFHEYCNPNKTYEYAHCGLLLLCIDDIPSVSEDFGSNCDLFSNYEQLAGLLKYYNENPEELHLKRRKSLEHAIEHLVWERNEQKIIDAYKLA